MRRAGGQRALDFAAEQAEGGASTRVQGDRLHLAHVRTRDGQEVLLGMVADGGKSPRASDAAEITIRSVVEAVSRSPADGLSRALSAGLSGATAAWKESLGESSQTVEVSATAVCVSRRRLYAAHAGRSGAFLVRGGQAHPLVKSTGPLGSGRVVDPISGPKEGLELKPGDWVMIASDGLTRTSSETGRPFVEPAEIPGCLRGAEPREAARHLISIALGRDADDNISVGLIRMPGEVRRKSLRPEAWGIAAAAIILVGGLVASSLINRPPETLTDFGYAVVLEGTGLAEIPGGEGPIPLGHLDLIPAGATLRSSSPMQLSLQSTAAERGGLPVATFHLATDTQLALKQLDAYRETASQGEDLPPTILEPQSGLLLVRFDGGRRQVQIKLMDALVTLSGDRPAILGAIADSSGPAFDCLTGECLVLLGSGREVRLAPGHRLRISSGEPVPLGPADIQAWSKICPDCPLP